MTNDQREAWKKFLAGKQLGPYILDGFRGGGEYGLVFNAVDTRTDDRRAIKVLTPGSQTHDMMEFEDEGRLLRKLARSSSVVTIHDSGEAVLEIDSDRGISLPFKYHVLERATEPLTSLLADESIRRDLDWEEKIQLWRGAVRGIHQMHLKKCVHRDIKSSNCLLFLQARNRTECKIADLGKARDLSEPARLPPAKYLVARGDLRFAPPEFLFLQGRGNEPSFKLGDLYGLGSLLFEIATGQGITAVALGFGPTILRQNIQDHQLGIRTDLSGLRPQYSRAFAVLDRELPQNIRFRVSSLVRQLCDPVPEMRLPRTFAGRRRHPGEGLQWLLRQADILIRSSCIPQQRQPLTRVGGRTV
ncbi:protein kinase domain-containing protein [Micromonospora chersina]|uniref:protein kinase domain-containing protein n=1 Tax=Micromonospora chersina TaxID=47854 RepID=UPI0033F97B00